MNRIKILATVLVILIIGLVIVLVTNMGNSSFRKPDFDKNAVSLIETDDVDKYMTIKDGYSFYIDGNPKIENKYLYVNFSSKTSEDIYLKVRIFSGDKVIGESGLIKTGESLEKVKISNNKVKEVTYLIMSYEKDTYYSMGEVRLNAKVGDSNA